MTGLNEAILEIIGTIEKYGTKNKDMPIAKWLKNHQVILKFLSFCVVGAIGVGINGLVYTMLGASGYFPWFMGILIATISNFTLNTYLVYEEQNKIVLTTEEKTQITKMFEFYMNNTKYSLQGNKDREKLHEKLMR